MSEKWKYRLGIPVGLAAMYLIARFYVRHCSSLPEHQSAFDDIASLIGRFVIGVAVIGSFFWIWAWIKGDL